MTGVTLWSRFWAKVDKTETCWLFVGAKQRSGYGSIYTGPRPGQTALAHRLSYQWLVGAIPDGMSLDHLCRVRNCVNPDHLEAVTPGENTRRGDAAAQLRNGTTCRNGLHSWPSCAEVITGELRCGECHQLRVRRNSIKRGAARAARREADATTQPAVGVGAGSAS